LQGLQENVWAILPSKLAEIVRFVESRCNGIAIDLDDFDRTEDQQTEGNGGVAVIPILGTLFPRSNMLTEYSGGTSTFKTEQLITEAVENDDIHTLLFEIDSPGGVVTGVEDLRQKILWACNWTRRRKRVVALGRGMVASAAYWIASSAPEFYVTPSTEVGSIGVFLVVREMSRAAENAGVKFTVIKSSDLKGAGNEYEPLSEKAKAELQRRVDATADAFVAAVAENRKVTPEVVQARFGSGAVFTAGEAEQRGMIDGIRTVDQLMIELSRNGRAGTIGTSAAEVQTPIVGLESTDMSVVWFEQEAPKMPETTKTDATTKVSRSSTEATPIAAVDTPTSRADIDAAAREAIIAERYRVRDLRARADLLKVTDALVQQAIDDGTAVDDAVRVWLDDAAKNAPMVSGRVESVESEVDKVCDAAIGTLGSRLSFNACEPNRDMQGMRTIDIAREVLRASGQRITQDDQQMALNFLQLGGSETQYFAADTGGSWHQPGSFPNVLSNLANKGLETGFQLATVTYPIWTAKLMDLADLKPKPFMTIALNDEMDKKVGDEEAKTLAMTEDFVGWIQGDIFDNKVGLTAVMVANDDLDAFQQGLLGLATAHENTLNGLCVGLLTGNVVLTDGQTLFENTYHLNDKTSGAAPSGSELGAMRTKHRLQTGPGGYGYIKTPPKYLLAPAALETAAIQATMPLLPGETTARAADSNINTVRGLITPVIEPELDANSSTIYYTVADPALRRCIVHAFQRGYGRGGQRRTWFEDSRLTRYVALEGRFAAAAISYRGIVRNAGA